MPKKPKQPAIVAELGRPETPEETRARKARDSKLYRERKTVNNLVLSLLVSLGLVLVMVAIVPRGTGGYIERNVDVSAIAKQAAGSAPIPLAAPQTPDKWLAKQAEMRFSKDDFVSYWYIGYTTPGVQYASIKQGYTPGEKIKQASPSWVNKELEKKKATGKVQIDGVTWTEYDHHEDSDNGSNVRYGLVTEIGDSTLIVSGTDSKEVITELAKQAYASVASKTKGGAS